jgi:hypothetical protein
MEGRTIASRKRRDTVLMTIVELVQSERIVKSSERVRDLGEVFTPNSTVQEILDLLPKSIWKTHPSPSFLEPACGDGNFLVAILERKLNQISSDFNKQKLPAGTAPESAQFHALEALASIYAVDISVENIIGGTPGHEIGARSRIMTAFIEWNKSVLGKNLNERSLVFRAGTWIIEHNLIIGNMLRIDSEGKPTGRDQIPLIEYSWNPDTLSVALSISTLGDVIAAQEAESGAMLNLFSPDEPKQFWQGKAFSINDAERIVAPELFGITRNGTGRRI